MPRSLTAQEQDSISLTELAQTIENDTGGFERHLNRDLRLPERNGGTAEIKVHTETLNNPLTAGANRAAAMALVQNALKREVGESAAAKLWNNSGLEGASRITVGDLKALTEKVGHFHQASAQIQAENQRLTQLRSQPPPAMQPPTLADLTAAPTAQLKVSDQGSGGAVITPTAVAKIEHEVLGKGALETARVAEAAFGLNSPDSPLQFTPVVLYNDAASKAGANQALSQLQASLPAKSNESLDGHVYGLNPDSRSYDTNSVHLAPRVDGKPLNKLDVAEKIALFKNGALAQDIGKASSICPVLGLNDHVGPNPVQRGDLKDFSFTSGNQNISNLMLSNESGRLVAIDYAPTPNGANNNYGNTSPDKAVACVATFLTNISKSPESFDQAMNQMVNSSGSKATPFSGTMNVFLNPAGGDSFLSPEEADAFDLHVTPEEKRQFAANLVMGSLDGLEYLHQHEQQLDQALHESSERCGLDVNQERNFMSRQEMANMQQGLAGIDFQQLRANLNAVSQGLPPPHQLTAPGFQAAPVAALGAPPPLPVEPTFATLSPEQLAQITATIDLTPGTGEPINYQKNAKDALNQASMTAPDIKRTKANISQLEKHLIEQFEIEPLNARIVAAEQSLASLTQDAGLPATAPDVVKAESELDVHEARVSALNRTMQSDAPRNRLAEINQEHEQSKQALAQQPAGSNQRVGFAAGTKEVDFNARHDRDLVVTSALTARRLVGRLGTGELGRGDVQAAAKLAFTDSGARGYDANTTKDPQLTTVETDNLHADIKPTLDRVNELEAQITAINTAQDQLKADARNDLQSTPARITDPGMRTAVVNLQRQIAEKEAKIAGYDKDLAKLEKGGITNSLRALRHGGSSDARKHFEDNKTKAQQDLDVLQKSLNAEMDIALQDHLRETGAPDVSPAISDLRQQQTKLLNDYHDSRQAQAAQMNVVPLVETPLNNPSIPSNADIRPEKSSLKKGAEAETNQASLDNAALRGRFTGRQAPNNVADTSPLKVSLPLSDMAQKAAADHGVLDRLREFNEGNDQGLSVSPQQMVSRRTQQEIQDRIDELGAAATPEDIHRAASEVIDQSMQRKQAVLAHLDKREGISDEHRVFATEAALRNDYASPAAFDRSYFRGDAPSETQAPLVQNVDLGRLKIANDSVGDAFKSLENGQPYNQATYDPAGYFDQVDTGTDPSLADFRLNAAIMGQALAELPEGQTETRQVLAQRLAGYQIKFTPTNDAKILNSQINPLQIGEQDVYNRSTLSNFTEKLNGQLANSLEVNPKNVQAVTDSRFMETLKRSHALEDQASVLTWGEEDFDRIYDGISDKKNVFLDVTPFMAATVQGHEAGEVGEAIQVTNEFMHDALKAGVADYLAKDPAHQALDANGKAAAREQFISDMQKRITLGAMVNVGEQPALYTAALGRRSGEPGRETFTEGATPDPEVFRNQIAHNGFTVGPQQALEQWSRGAEKPEMMLAKLDQLSGGKLTKGVADVKLPDAGSKLARFDSADEFCDTQIFQDFKKLSQDANLPPYVKISAGATSAMLEGMKEMNLNESFSEQGIDPVLQLSYNRMQGAMQKAVAMSDDPTQFKDYLRQMEVVQEQLSNVLAVAKPYSQSQFNSVMKEATDILPDGFPPEIKPQFALKNSGMRALSSTLSGLEALHGDRPLNIAMQKDCYYESGFAVGEAQNHNHLTLDGDDLAASAGEASKQLGGQKIDMYVAEFHHNISISREDYHAEDVTAQVDELFKQGMVSDRFTVALDTTIAATNAKEIKNFLDHNAERIASGQLNVVMYRSGQKFDMMGMDNYNGGVMAMVNNGEDFADFNQAVEKGRGVDNLGSQSVQGLTMMQKHAQEHLNDYRGAVMQATAKLGSARSAANPAGLPEHMILTPENRGDAMIQIASNQDDQAVFLDLRNPWLDAESPEATNFNNGMANLLTKMSAESPGEFQIEGRASFGFMHSNVSVIGGDKFRFNPGLEDADTLERYSKLLEATNDVLMQSRVDYPDPDDFNALTGKLVSPTKAEGMIMLMKQQMQLNEGQQLSPDQRLEAAQFLHEVGNQRGAARHLDALSSEQGLSPQQTQQMQTLDAKVKPLLGQRPPRDTEGLRKSDMANLHESTSEMRAMLRQGPISDPQAFLANLGKAQEASRQLGAEGAQQRVAAMLGPELKLLPPAQLEMVSANAAKMAALLPNGDPRRQMMTNIGKFAEQDLVMNLAQNNADMPSDLQIRDEFLDMADARQRQVGETERTPRTTMGDVYASFNYYLDNPQEMQGPAVQPSDRIISRGGPSQEEKLMDALIGQGVENMDGINAAFADPAVTSSIQKLVQSMPPEQRALYNDSRIKAMPQLAESGLRTMCIGYQGMLDHAHKGNAAKFVKAGAEFENSINGLQREQAFIGDLLTNPENLAKLPAEHRDTLRKFGENAQAIGAELKRPGGFGQNAVQFATLAMSKPDQVMKQTCDVNLPQILRMPAPPPPPVAVQPQQSPRVAMPPPPNYPAPAPPGMDFLNHPAPNPPVDPGGYEADVGADKKTPSKLKQSGSDAEDEQDVEDLDDNEIEGEEVEVKKEKPEVAKVGDMLRKSGGPIIGAQGRTQSTGDLKALAGDLGEKPKLERTNSLRDSKEWQAASRPKGPAPKSPTIGQSNP